MRRISRRTALNRLLTSAGLAAAAFCSAPAGTVVRVPPKRRRQHELRADVAILGGGLGGCAAALSALTLGRNVVLTEPTDWIGGQLTQQGVPPDEHPWIETHGCTASYRRLRDGIRDYYRRHYPLTSQARAIPQLNPGQAWVSRIAHEPQVARAVLESFLAPHLSSGRLRLLLEHRPTAAEVDHDRVRAVQLQDLRSGSDLVVRAETFIDATELGDLLPLTGTEFVTGAESQAETGEPHAAPRSNPANQQAFTCCFAMDYLDGEDHTIERPRDYAFWRDYVPRLTPPWTGRLLDWDSPHPRTLERRTLGFHPSAEVPVNLWTYRRIRARSHFEPGARATDITVVNWPQNDFLLGNLVGVSESKAQRHVDQAKQLSLSLLYWLQTSAPRPEGRTGWPGLRLRPDIMGTADGLAKHPYVRESRRIRAVFTIREQDISKDLRLQQLPAGTGPVQAARFADSVGLGSYPVDLHPTSTGDNYIDFESLPFQIPLGALLPVRQQNLLPAAKNLGSTHVTNGAYRLHPIEWNIGEAAGALAAFCLNHRRTHHEVRAQPKRLAEFQETLRRCGVELHWP
jgi:hypothetical protein